MGNPSVVRVELVITIVRHCASPGGADAELAGVDEQEGAEDESEHANYVVQ
jgi:hypothetical protein